MPTRLFVCNGCCCGRTDRGNAPVPYESLNAAWKAEGLDASIHLSLSSCLGPCSMNNVVLMMNGQERVWLGRLTTDEQYTALLEWGRSISTGSSLSEIPNLLQTHRFIPV